MLKRMFSLASLLCLGLLTSCQSNPTENSSNSLPEYGTGTEAEAETGLASENDDTANSPVMQLLPPQPGDTLVILHTTMGDITIRLFPEEAPMAYENFVTLARDGYYDGVIFHRVIQNFMIQGGDPEGTGMGGESIWGHGFGPEFSWNLRHFRGALAMAQSSMPNSIGSQFYIVHNDTLGDDILEFFEYLYSNQDELLGTDEENNNVYIRDLFSADQLAAYFSHGGTPHLDLAMGMITGSGGGHTVFGQVTTDSMNVVDAIAAIEVDEMDRSLIDVVIERTTVTTY